jgi:photosystem II stability/assembly factor-like uncharacterized protein
LRRVLVFTAVAVLAAAFPASGGAAVSVGHSAWEWGNPRPQGNTFLSIEFQDTDFSNRGYAAGEFGTVLRTDDGGSSWIGLPTGITVGVRRIEMISPDSLVVAGGCFLRRSDNAGQSFTRLPWTPRDTSCASDISSVAFPTSDIGYVVTFDGTVLRSADGGRSWSRRTALPGTSATGSGFATARDIVFTAPDVGLAVIGAGAGGAILRTTDGGNSWTPVQSAPAALNELLDTATTTPVAALYAIGNEGLVYRSTDDGQTWEQRNVTVGTPPLSLRTIDCADSETCIVAKEQGDELFRTSDGGTTWTPVTPSTERVFAAEFVSATRAVAVGASGVTVVSDDAGVTWARIGDALAGSFHRLRASSSSLAFALGTAGTLARTLDSGETWRPISVPTSEAILDVSFPSANVGYALDFAGNLFRTENGGTSWAILDTGTTTAPRALIALDEATVILVGPRGLRRSTNAGQEFTPISDGVVRSASLHSVDRVGSAIYVWGDRTAAFSLNGGRSWRRLAALPTRGRVREYDWVTTRVAFALDSTGRLFQTRNGGRNWRELATTGTSFATGIAFSSLAEGYLQIREYAARPSAGYVLRTIDGGRTWRPQLIAQNEITDVAAPGGTDFALASPSYLFRSAQVSPQDRTSTLSLTPRSSRPRLTRRGATVQLNGRLSPPEGGERIVVSFRGVRSGRWTSAVVTAASNGSFTVTRRIRGATIFVAQWEGDDDRRGVGSRAVVVTPRR